LQFIWIVTLNPVTLVYQLNEPRMKKISVVNAEIWVSLTWVYVNGKRITTDGFDGFRNWCIMNDIDVTTFANWPFEEGIAFRYRRSKVRMHAIEHFGKRHS
jgi:hypothetical protein